MSTTRPQMETMASPGGTVRMAINRRKRSIPALRAVARASGKPLPHVAVGFGGAGFLDALADAFTPPGFAPTSVRIVPHHGQWEDMERIGEDFASAIEVVRAGHAPR